MLHRLKYIISGGYCNRKDNNTKKDNQKNSAVMINEHEWDMWELGFILRNEMPQQYHDSWL